MKFIWDEKKNHLNKKKHGVSFELASLVFHDPFAMSMLDEHIYHEERWLTFGNIESLILCVVHTVSEEYYEEEIRIISARATTPSEKWQYYTHTGNEKRN